MVGFCARDLEKTYQAVTLGQKYDKDELISIDSSCNYMDELKRGIGGTEKESRVLPSSR